MKSAIVVAAALTASVFSLLAQAQESAPLTRAEVRADLARAQQEGLLNQPDPVYPRQVPVQMQQQTQTAATPEATQAVGGVTPMSESGATLTPMNSIYRGN